MYVSKKRKYQGLPNYKFQQENNYSNLLDWGIHIQFRKQRQTDNDLQHFPCGILPLRWSRIDSAVTTANEGNSKVLTQDIFHVLSIQPEDSF